MMTKEERAKHLRSIASVGGKQSKRGKDTVDSLIKRIHVVAKNEGKAVKITVRVL